ncbi:hypothetical protein ACFP1H_07910 [Secundilactobacillus hailunensis]|uniref:Glycosyltransferase RgtA/B/C/D-like domain-containing protein n=1 Tax=Secundilactobacillus hailunensis TaxID=2559923 RepID=A0ABW1T9Q0_9LACO|nr:hypothetical protein [Secundilactobacillus hailunensis]
MKLIRDLHWFQALIIAGIITLAIAAPVIFPHVTMIQRAGLGFGGLIVAGILIGTAHWLQHQSARTQRWVLTGLLITIGILQVGLAIFFVDAGAADSFIVKNQSVMLASHLTTHWNSYFQVYSNNNNLVLLQTALLKICYWLGLTAPWRLLNLLRFLWLDTALWAGLTILKTWHRESLRPLFAGMWLLTIPLFFFGLFLYSDPLVMPIPIVTLALWQQSRRHTGWARYGLDALLVSELSIGVLIKPNMIVILIAFIVMLGYGWFRRITATKTVLVLGLACILACGGGSLIAKNAAKQAGYQADSNLALPSTSWIAMSWNPATNGEYTFQDAYQERLLPTKQQKAAHAKQLLQKRIIKLGPTGVTKHLIKKSDAFLSAGTFGGFYLTNQWQTAPHWFLASKEAINYRLSVISQILYIGVLLVALLFFATPMLFWENSFLSLGLLGLMSFHIIFWEVEPRYALPLLPLFLLWGALGTQQVPALAAHVHWRLPKYTLPVLTGIGLVIGGIGLTSFQKTTHLRNVAEQSDGKYYNNYQLRLRPGQSVTSRIRVTVPSSAIILQLSQHSRTPVAVKLYRNGKLAAHVAGPANLSNQLRYHRTANGLFTVKVANIGHRNVPLGVAKSAFLINQEPLARHKNLYLRYHVLLGQIAHY